ncbi:hypothetical protein KP509_11G047500 [Ceratopteris richardii]|nr:hypothetical protein KP509_11G047500 [Ceratopteris richardii]
MQFWSSWQCRNASLSLHLASDSMSLCYNSLQTGLYFEMHFKLSNLSRFAGLVVGPLAS